jgi:hypothetical protein
MSVSIIDEKKMVSQDEWLVALLRKQTKGKEEIAFLLVEGRTEDDQILLRRYEFFECPNERGKGLLSVRPEVIASPEQAPSVLLGDFLQGDAFNGIAWLLRVDKANQLHQLIEADKQVELPYQREGNRYLIHQSISSSGHNSFTWAREKLEALQEPHIVIPNKLTDFIAAHASFYISGEKPVSEERNGCYLM